jgi:uncharacterized membrane protein HdeD (DUF308 family)
VVKVYLKKTNWRWQIMSAAGVAFVGLLVLFNPAAVGFAGARILPWMLVIGGVFQVIGAFGSRQRGLVMPLIIGTLLVGFGLALRFANDLPFFNLALMMGLLFLFSGGAKLLWADIASGTPYRLWIHIAAGVSLAMGVITFLAWGSISGRLVALFLGVELLSSAAALTAIGLAQRQKEGD